MMIPITEIPTSIVDNLRPYRDLFPRVETFVHLMEYATGLVVLEKPSIRRLSECLVYDVDQSCINKMITQSNYYFAQIKPVFTHYLKGLKTSSELNGSRIKRSPMYKDTFVLK